MLEHIEKFLIQIAKDYNLDFLTVKEVYNNSINIEKFWLKLEEIIDNDPNRGAK
jgi:hypothetical protein